MADKTTIWAFDLGKGSIGEAVREGNKFLHKASLLIPADFAETKTAAGRRRMWRTRIAHKEREKWLTQVLCDAGIPPLIGRRTENVNGKWQPVIETPEQKLNRERLEREFAAPGDDTCYTSCLLRIKLLRGEKLEPWQIYKALHSAIQRRGYGKVPWAAKETKRSGKSEEQVERELAQKDPDYRSALEAWPKFKQSVASEFHFPCYYQAEKMGLWDPSKPSKIKTKVDCRAGSARQVRFDRFDIENEIHALVDAAAKYHPSLKGKANYVLYGPAETAYASYNPQLRKKFHLREGGENDWQGVLGQKIPRFDNRIVEKCVLIPRLNVCKVDVRKDKDGNPYPESLLASEATFLMKLKNIGVLRNGKPGRLNATEIKTIFEKCGGKYSFTKTQWQKQCEKFGLRPFSQYEIEAPKVSGRSRFCRPALGILKQLILSGQNPKEFHAAELTKLNGNKNPVKGLMAEDLKFLLQMGDSWEGIFIPNQKLEALVQNADDRTMAIRTLIGSQNDPIVRHRLSLFAERLVELERRFGTPEQVVLEFVREDFMGEKAKRELMKFQRDRAADRIRAKQEAAAAGATEGAAGFKMELLKAQGGICLYTGEGLIPEELDEYDIDHIVPRTKGGPDAAVNYVLTRRGTNAEKDNRTPFEWLSKTQGWDSYVNRVRSRIGALRNKKVSLLILPNAEELVQKYTALAETAWISKLAQAIISLRFGWNKGNDATKRRVTVISGGLTGRIRRKYRLNSILNPNAKDEEEAEKKNRDDDRHHALDAMVISFIPNWARNAGKEHFFRFPDEIHKNAKAFFEKEIEEVIPQNVCFEKAALAETIYGVRLEGARKVIVQRAEVKSLAYKPTAPGKSIFDLKYARKQIASIRDSWIKDQLAEFLSTEPNEPAWLKFCENFSLARKDGSPGSAIKFIRMDVGEANEYADLSKDGTGAFRKALKGHQGQIVYLDENQKPRVRPVYAFQSVSKVRKELLNDPKNVLIGFFRSKCLVEIKKSVDHPKTPLAPGKYSLNTIRSDGFVVVTNASGQISQPISLAKLLASGFKRIC